MALEALIFLSLAVAAVLGIVTSKGPWTPSPQQS